MRRIHCHECSKIYDYDLHDFCPRCGAYTQPKKQLRFDGRGRVVRVDGINEQNHRGSFVHAERHQEEKQRREKGLSRERELLSRDFAALAKEIPALGQVKRPSTAGKTAAASAKSRTEQNKKQEGLPLGFILLILYFLFKMFF